MEFKNFGLMLMSRGLFKKGILEKFIGKKRLPSIEGSLFIFIFL
jgi:hypothetical protein